MKPVSFQETGVSLFCVFLVRMSVIVSVNTDLVPDKGGGWRDNRFPECSLVRSDEKVSVANL